MWVVALAAIVVLLVLAEAWRQRRTYGRPSGRPNLVGGGLLEVQRVLQPDRKVEVLAAEAQKCDVQDADQDEAGEDRCRRDGGGPAG